MRLLAFGSSLAAAVLAAACGGDGGPSPGEAQTSPSAATTATATLTIPGLATDTTTPASTPTPQTPPGDPSTLALTFERVTGDLERPTFVAHAGDGSGRLFVLEKAGRIRVVEDGQLLQRPFLDLTSLVTAQGNEQGLLGLAFHPEFESNGRFFVAYTAAADGANTLAEVRRSASDPAVADPASHRVLLAIPDRRPNHNGGMVAFGPDGYLYLSTGDGGGGGDPDLAGQDVSVLPAKILRLDVDSGDDSYGIPADNPFNGDDGARPETWAFGLRNPWRFSFDRETGDLWIADVGQGQREEVNFQPASSPGGENYGWSVLEGSRCYRPAEGCDATGTVLPVHDYDHSNGCSITGGYVYRGAAIPALRGFYLFVDYCAGQVFALARGEEGASVYPLTLELAGISSFGEDEAGEIYVAADRGGAVYRLIGPR